MFLFIIKNIVTEYLLTSLKSFGGGNSRYLLTLKGNWTFRATDVNEMDTNNSDLQIRTKRKLAGKKQQSENHLIFHYYGLNCLLVL